MSIRKKFYPKSYFNNVIEITYEFLNENNIKAILLDIDNTLIDHDNNIIEGLEKWVEELKEKGIKFCILSNTNKKKKAEKMSVLLNIPYIFFAIKPLKKGFLKAKKILNIEKNEDMAIIGDQIMTDILGGNRCKIYSILVAPMKSSEIIVTKINRILEKNILKKYFKENNIEFK